MNADGYLSDFGDESAFESKGFTFYNTCIPEWSYWSGFALSNRTETTFVNLTPDQFNSIVGHGVNGSKNYLVAYPQGEIIEVNEEGGKELRGFYVTNEAWAVDAILNGDGMTPGAFTTGDYLLLKVIGNHPDGTADTISVYLADYRSENEAEHYYLNDWTRLLLHRRLQRTPTDRQALGRREFRRRSGCQRRDAIGGICPHQQE